MGFRWEPDRVRSTPASCSICSKKKGSAHDVQEQDAALRGIERVLRRGRKPIKEEAIAFFGATTTLDSAIEPVPSEWFNLNPFVSKRERDDS
jgi:hypothetical protein